MSDLIIDIIIRLDSIFKIIYKIMRILIVKVFPKFKNSFQPIILTN